MPVDFQILKWFIAGVVLSFLVPLIFGNSSFIPLDLYYAIYFLIIGTFITLFFRSNQINLMQFISANLIFALVLSGVFSFLMIKNVLSLPATEQLTGSYLIWSIVWRGLVYGLIDGLLLSVFPFVVVWTAFSVGDRPSFQKFIFSLVVYLFVVVITSAYHLGYKDFRSKKVMKANIGNILISTPTVISANPVASPLTHAAMHISAVVHSPETELFLPPHQQNKNN